MNAALSTMLINQLTAYYDTAEKRTKTNKASFKSIKDNIETRKMGEIEESNSTSSDKPKTLEEFKKEVYDILNSVPITGLAGSMISINISDAAFERMMNDEQFMKVQLGALIRDLGWPPTPMYSPAYVVFEIDPVDGYRGTSYGSNYKSVFENRSKDSFWEKRRKKFKENMEEQQKYYYNKKLNAKRFEMKKLNAEAAAKRIAANKGENLITSYEKKAYVPSLFSAAELFDDILL